MGKRRGIACFGVQHELECLVEEDAHGLLRERTSTNEKRGIKTNKKIKR